MCFAAAGKITMPMTCISVLEDIRIRSAMLVVWVTDRLAFIAWLVRVQPSYRTR